MHGLKGLAGQGLPAPARAARPMPGARSESLNARPVRRFTISPAVNGRSTWDLDVHGPLSLGSAGTWLIVPVKSFWASAKLWGGGGGVDIFSALGAGGGAAKVAGDLFLRASVPYLLIVGAAGAPSTYAGDGGGFSAIQIARADFLALAGGGGGGAGGGGYEAASGAASPGLGASPAASGQTAGSGTQYEPGAGGAAGGGSGLAGIAGDKLAGASPIPAQGGGGDGWFGGGRGGIFSDGVSTPVSGGGGGGSCYVHPQLRAAQVWAGSGQNPGDASDADRNGAGLGALTSTPANPGRVILS